MRSLAYLAVGAYGVWANDLESEEDILFVRQLMSNATNATVTTTTTTATTTVATTTTKAGNATTTTKAATTTTASTGTTTTTNQESQEVTTTQASSVAVTNTSSNTSSTAKAETETVTIEQEVALTVPPAIKGDTAKYNTFKAVIGKAIANVACGKGLADIYATPAACQPTKKGTGADAHCISNTVEPIMKSCTKEAARRRLEERRRLTATKFKTTMAISKVPKAKATKATSEYKAKSGAGGTGTAATALKDSLKAAVAAEVVKELKADATIGSDPAIKTMNASDITVSDPVEAKSTPDKSGGGGGGGGTSAAFMVSVSAALVSTLVASLM